MDRRVGEFVRDLFTNWKESDARLSRKLAMTLRNRARAYGTLKGCCGHHGEPGC